MCAPTADDTKGLAELVADPRPARGGARCRRSADRRARAAEAHRSVGASRGTSPRCSRVRRRCHSTRQPCGGSPSTQPGVERARLPRLPRRRGLPSTRPHRKLGGRVHAECPQCAGADVVAPRRPARRSGNGSGRTVSAPSSTPRSAGQRQALARNRLLIALRSDRPGAGRPYSGGRCCRSGASPSRRSANAGRRSRSSGSHRRSQLPVRRSRRPRRRRSGNRLDAT